MKRAGSAALILQTLNAGQPARSDRTDVTGLVPVTALSRWALNFHRAVTGLNPVTSIGFGCADPSAGFRQLYDKRPALLM